MISQSNKAGKGSNASGRHGAAILLSLMAAAVLSACASFAGIGSGQQIASPQTQPETFLQTQSLPPEHGQWPAANWAAQFGDRQLTDLIEEALRGNPSLDEARARVAAAAAFSESAYAQTLPKVNADASTSRQQYSSTALVPPPYAGSWQTENKAVLSASYELDLWGKNSAAWKSSISKLRASRAEQEKVKLTLSASVASSYNQLAGLFAQRDLAQQEVDLLQGIGAMTERRVGAGLDTETERQNSQRASAASRAALTALDGRILTTRYQLAALLGQGPDRGLRIQRPALGTGDSVSLPDNLPADLLARRPDIVAARWRVDAVTHDIDNAKADFYPNINLSAAIGLDAFGFGRFLSAASGTASAGPAIHLPIFDGGALRAGLKGRYADFDLAVASYNSTLISALSEVASRLAEIRSADAQLADTQAAATAAGRAAQLAASQYKGGLTTQLVALQARANALSSEQALVNLSVERRSKQIALAAALGGGFAADTTSN
jgi:NodT family efflux transporter outer membrane factor (OMF) lipoprotein